jgi:glycosyltransferase involved in cell wall biosynthesis
MMGYEGHSLLTKKLNVIAFLNLLLEVTGGESRFVELMKRLCENGAIDLTVVTSSMGRNFCKERGLSAKFKISTCADDKLIAGLTKLRGRRLYLATLTVYAFRTFKTLFKLTNGSDVIIAVSHYSQDILPATFQHLINPKSKLVVYHHGILIPPEHGLFLRTGSILYNYVGSLLAIQFSNLIFTINKSTWNYLQRLGAKNDKVVITSNGVNVNELNKVVGDTKYYDACFLGRLNKSKGVLDLPKVWAIVCQTRPNAKLIIAGSGTEMDEVKKMVKNLHLEGNIVLTGLLSEDKKYEILGNSRVFMYPSYLESWGIAIAESMACGLPVIAYNLPVYKEVFSDRLITVPLGSVDSMADQILLLLENPDVARKIGEACKEFVKRYDWGVVADRELSAILALKGKEDE